jgi:hypothetical protein
MRSPLKISPEKHLRMLYTYAVDWCMKHSVPLSWIRVWGADEVEAHGSGGLKTVHGAVYNGHDWAPLIELDEPLPRPNRYSAEDLRARAWITTPNIDEMVERGLSSYEIEQTKNIRDEASARLVLATIDMQKGHSWTSKANKVSHRPDFGSMQCYICLAFWSKWYELLRPCTFRLEPLLEEKQKLGGQIPF